jgi:hypothetical protein
MTVASRYPALQPDIKTLGIDDLIAMDVPERELLFDLPTKSLMNGRRGDRARRVLYVDGEMTLIDLQRRRPEGRHGNRHS